MAEQTKRQELESYLAARALQDPGFREKLLQAPSRPSKMKFAFISVPLAPKVFDTLLILVKRSWACGHQR